MGKNAWREALRFLRERNGRDLHCPAGTRWLARKYQLTDYFFDLTQCIEENKLGQVTSLAKSSRVELMTHPIVPREADYLMSDEFSELLQRLENRSKLCLRTRQFYFRVHQILALKLIQRKLIEMN
jgi:hypothetical protein